AGGFAHSPGLDAFPIPRGRSRCCAAASVAEDVLRIGRTNGLSRTSCELTSPMMLFRFIAALVLIVAVSLSAIALEKRELALKRAISLQHFRMDQLMEERARLRIRLHKLSAARFSNGASSDN